MASQKLHWGIIGAGKCAKDWCNVLLLESQDHVIKAVASTGESASRLAQDFGIPTACTPDELVRRNDVDVIYVATNHGSHYENTLKALQHGKHVVCEKPMGITSQQVEKLVAEARHRKLFLVEATWSRFSPAYAALRDWIKDGEIGDPFLVMSRFFTHEALYGKEDNPSDPLNSITLERGQYAVALATMVFGTTPIGVKASGLKRDKCDDTTSVILEFPDNRVASFVLTRHVEADSHADVYGTKGRIYVADKFNYPLYLLLNNERHEFPLPGRKPPVGFFNYDGPKREGFMYLQRHVKECIDKGLTESPLLPLDESVGISKVLDEILKQCGVAVAAKH